MTPERKAQLRRLCEGATPNYRKACISMPGESLLQMGDEDRQGAFQWRSIQLGTADVDFLVASRTALPELLDAVDAAEEETRKVRDVLRRVLDERMNDDCQFVINGLDPDLRAEAEAACKEKP